jgi:hypothetical protein
MQTVDDILLARDAASALAGNGWRVTHAATHSGGTADLAADRTWSRGRLTARVRLIVRCDAREERFVFSSLAAERAADRLPFYSFGDDDPAQRRALAAVLDDGIKQLHAAAYPREVALTEPARVDAPPARTLAAATRDAVLDEAFASIDAVRRDLFQHDLDIVRDDFDIDRDVAAQTAIDAAHRCDLLIPIVITNAELWSLPENKRRDWIRIERSSLVGHERQWIDVVEGAAFARYADALARHLTSAFRKRRFAPAGASSRS